MRHGEQGLQRMCILKKLLFSLFLYYGKLPNIILGTEIRLRIKANILSLLIYDFTFCRRPLVVVRRLLKEPAHFPGFFDWGTYFVLLFNGFKGTKLIN